eukprot:5806019-Alexandrium_andersonii.AAC.1
MKRPMTRQSESSERSQSGPPPSGPTPSASSLPSPEGLCGSESGGSGATAAAGAALLSAVSEAAIAAAL